MKKTKIILALIGCLAILLVMTNPSVESHRKEVKAHLHTSMQTTITEKSSKIGGKFSDILGSLGASLGNNLIDQTVEQLVSRENYVVFSLTKLTWDGEENIIGIGLVNRVFVSNKLDTVFQDYIDKKLN